MDGRKILVVLAQSTSVPQIPERSDVVRVNQYKQSLAIESDGKKGSRGKSGEHVGKAAGATILRPCCLLGMKNA